MAGAGNGGGTPTPVPNPYRVGFKRTYAEGAFDFAAVQTLFADMKAAFIAAGFTVVLDTPTELDVLRLGAQPGTMDDDVPHWAIVFNDSNPQAGIQAYAAYGADYMDGNGYSSSNTLLDTGWLGQPTPEVRLWFACDGYAGWWWLVGLAANAESPSGYDLRFCMAGTTSRRYPSDQFKGLCARYGLWDDWGDWNPAYAVDADGNQVGGPWTGTWSPFGEGWSNNGQRHAGSVLPKMAVPQFPNRDSGITACVLGEFNEVLILTDGYALEEVPVPGWIAFKGNQWDQPFALPAPDNFDFVAAAPK